MIPSSVKGEEWFHVTSSDKFTHMKPVCKQLSFIQSIHGWSAWIQSQKPFKWIMFLVLYISQFINSFVESQRKYQTSMSKFWLILSRKYCKIIQWVEISGTPTTTILILRYIGNWTKNEEFIWHWTNNQYKYWTYIISGNNIIWDYIIA